MLWQLTLSTLLAVASSQWSSWSLGQEAGWLRGGEGNSDADWIKGGRNTEIGRWVSGRRYKLENRRDNSEERATVQKESTKRTSTLEQLRLADLEETYGRSEDLETRVSSDESGSKRNELFNDLKNIELGVWYKWNGKSLQIIKDKNTTENLNTKLAEDSNPSEDNTKGTQQFEQLKMAEADKTVRRPEQLITRVSSAASGSANNQLFHDLRKIELGTWYRRSGGSLRIIKDKNTTDSLNSKLEQDGHVKVSEEVSKVQRKSEQLQGGRKHQLQSSSRHTRSSYKGLYPELIKTAKRGVWYIWNESDGIKMIQDEETLESLNEKLQLAQEPRVGKKSAQMRKRPDEDATQKEGDSEKLKSVHLRSINMHIWYTWKGDSLEIRIKD